MIPTKTRLLVKFVQDNKSKIIVPGQDNPNKLTGKFYIEKVGKDCDPELKKGQEITLREHYYGITVNGNKDKGEFLLLIDEGDVWSYSEWKNQYTEY